MNNKLRKEIDLIVTLLQHSGERVQEMREGEEEKFANLPEGLQCSDRGEALEEASAQLEVAEGSIEEAIESLNAAKGKQDGKIHKQGGKEDIKNTPEA